MKLNYNSVLGRRASRAAQDLICPDLEWNQERYGKVLHQHMLPEGPTRWLEAGCGHRILPNGLEAIEMSAVQRSGFVIGMDMDWESLRIHRSVQLRVMASVDNVPFADGSFDLVGCNMVMEHLEHPGRALAELDRVLAPNGVLLLHTPNIKNYMVFLNHAASRLFPRRFVAWFVHSAEQRAAEDVFPTLYRMNSAEKLERAARDLGLQVVATEFLTGPTPFFNFFLPLALVQLAILRLLALSPLRRFQSTILMVMRKPAGSAVAEQAAP